MPKDKPNADERSKPVVNDAEAFPTAPAEPRAGTNRRRWPWVLILLAVVLGVGLLVFLRLRTPRVKPPAPPPVEIEMATAQKGAIPVYVNALGTVTPLATVTVSTRVDGQITKINYTEGQTAPEGAVLVEIDSRPFVAQLTTAQGQLERDQASLKEANVNLERYREAYKQNAIPKQQFDDQASLVQQLEGAVKLDEGQVAGAQTQVDYCTIKSPVAGRVGLRRVDIGNIVHASDTGGLVVITQRQPITVVFSVAEDYLPAIQEQMRKGEALPVEAWDRAQQKKIATGALAALDSQIDVTTGTVRLKAQFENKDEALFPNQFVNARLLLNTLKDVTLVPTETVQLGAQGAFVYVVKEDNTLEVRPVEVGVTEGGVESVDGKHKTADGSMAGLEPGEKVAKNNFNRLQAGTAVTERKASSEAAPGTGKATAGTGKPAKSDKGAKP